MAATPVQATALRTPQRIDPEELLKQLQDAVTNAAKAYQKGAGIDQAMEAVEAAQAALQEKFGIDPESDIARQAVDLAGGNVVDRETAALQTGAGVGPRGIQPTGPNAAITGGNVLARRSILPAKEQRTTAREAVGAAAGPQISRLAAAGDMRADADADILAAERGAPGAFAGPGTLTFTGGIQPAPGEGTLTPDSELQGIPRPVDSPELIAEINARAAEEAAEDDRLSITAAGEREDIAASGERPYIPGQFGFSSIDPSLPHEQRREALQAFLRESGPVDVDLGNVSIQEQFAGNTTGTLRKTIGLAPEYYEPQRSSGLERFARGLLSSGAATEFIGEAPGARFKDINVNDLLSDPLIAEEWAQLTDQEKAMVLYDGTDKAAEALALDQPEWDRLWGKTTQTTINDQLVRTKQGGNVTRSLSPIGRAPVEPGPVFPAAGAEGGPSAGAPARNPVPASTPRSRGAIGGVVGAGALASSIALDLGDLKEFIVTSDGYENPRGASVLMTMREARYHVGRGELQTVDDNPNEISNFVLVDSIGTGSPEIVRRQNKAARADPGFFEDHVRLSGEMEDVLTGEGADTVATRVPREFQQMRPDLYRIERARGPIALEDRAGRAFFATEDEAVALERGEARKQTTREEITTKEHVDRQVELRASLSQTGELMRRNADAGENGLGWLGAIAVMGARAIKGVAAIGGGDARETADRWARFFSGGELSAVELEGLRKELRSWASQRREILVGDKRLTNEDRKVLEGFISRGEAFASREAVAEMLEAFTKYEVITAELELHFNGEARFYPVSTQEEYDQSLDDLMGFGMPKLHAMDILDGFSNYPELRGPNTNSKGRPSVIITPLKERERR